MATEYVLPQQEENISFGGKYTDGISFLRGEVEMTCTFTIHPDGTVEGKGEDRVGESSWKGKISGSNIEITKTYEGHNVVYTGKVLIDDSEFVVMEGDWLMKGFLRNQSGKFKLTSTEILYRKYNWSMLEIKDQYAYFGNKRFPFEKLANNVHKIKIFGVMFLFIWDTEDEMLRVVRTKGEYLFIKKKRIPKEEVSGTDPISGEYNWNGKELDIKKKNCFFEGRRFAFDKVASTVYTVDMKERKFVFNWDEEDRVLGVVQAVGEDGFFERIDRNNIVYTIQIE